MPKSIGAVSEGGLGFSPSSSYFGITFPHSTQSSASSRFGVPQFGQKMVVINYLLLKYF